MAIGLWLEVVVDVDGTDRLLSFVTLNEDVVLGGFAGIRRLVYF